jgi:hypothetical protein
MNTFGLPQPQVKSTQTWRFGQEQADFPQIFSREQPHAGSIHTLGSEHGQLEEAPQKSKRESCSAPPRRVCPQRRQCACPQAQSLQIKWPLPQALPPRTSLWWPQLSQIRCDILLWSRVHAQRCGPNRQWRAKRATVRLRPVLCALSERALIVNPLVRRRALICRFESSDKPNCAADVVEY